MDIASKYC